MLFPPLLVPPSDGRLETWYCVFVFAACCPCACAGARTAAQQTASKAMKRISLALLVLRCVVISCPLLNFYDDTLGTGGKSPPEPLRAFGTSHFAVHSIRLVIPHRQTNRYS